MKTKLLYALICIVFLWLNFATTAQVKNKYNAFPAKKIAAIEWNTQNGLHHKQGFDVNYGSSAYAPLNNTQIAFLSDSEQRIKTYNTDNKKINKGFKASIPTIDIAFFDDRYYLSGFYQFAEHEKDGKLLRKINYPAEIKSLERIENYNGQLFLLSFDQKSYKLTEISGKIKYKIYEGWAINENLFAKTIIRSNNEFSICLFGEDKKQFEKKFTTGNGLSSVKIIGNENAYVYLDIEYITSQKPLETAREIVTVATSEDGIGSMELVTKIPNIYFTHIKRDLQIKNNKLFYYLGHPENAQIFSFERQKKRSDKPTKKLPEDLFNFKYHYNKNTLTLPFKAKNNTTRGIQRDSFVDPITRSEIIARAEAFETHLWEASDDNIYNNVWCDNQEVISAPWIEAFEENRSIPYMWDGFSSIEKYDEGMELGLSAGNINTKPDIGSMNCAEGVDCSGFVSQAWNTTYKYDTREFYPILEEYFYWSDLKPGDVANRSGHIRMMHTRNDNGSMLMIEATSRDNVWRVAYFTYTASDLQGSYEPFFLYSVVEDTPTSIARKPDNEMVTVFPNPCKGLVNIGLNYNMSDYSTFELFDSNGHRLLQKEVDSDFTIKMHNYQAGIYLLKIVSEKNIYIKRIVKQ